MAQFQDASTGRSRSLDSAFHLMPNQPANRQPPNNGPMRIASNSTTPRNNGPLPVSPIMRGHASMTPSPRPVSSTSSTPRSSDSFGFPLRFYSGNIQAPAIPAMKGTIPTMTSPRPFSSTSSSPRSQSFDSSTSRPSPLQPVNALNGPSVARSRSVDVDVSYSPLHNKFSLPLTPTTGPLRRQSSGQPPPPPSPASQSGSPRPQPSGQPPPSPASQSGTPRPSSRTPSRSQSVDLHSFHQTPMYPSAIQTSSSVGASPRPPAGAYQMQQTRNALPRTGSARSSPIPKPHATTWNSGVPPYGHPREAASPRTFPPSFEEAEQSSHHSAASTHPSSPLTPVGTISPNRIARPISPDFIKAMTRTHSFQIGEVVLPKKAKALGNSSISFDDFQLLGCVGTGKFGTVMKAKAKFDDKLYALKIVKKADLVHGPDPMNQTYEDVLHEMQVLRQLLHPFIVPLVCSFQTPERLVLVMPFLAGGEVFTLMRVLCWPESVLQVHAAQLVLALDYIHQQGFVYRDMKPENVVLDSEGNCMLTDFGLVVKVNTLYRDCDEGGTRNYMAPEVQKSKANDHVSLAGDWWGLGLVLFEMLCGIHPFMLPSGAVDMDAVLYKDPDLAEIASPTVLSDELQDLILGFLEKSPSQRLCKKQEIQDHPWFEGLDWDGVLARTVCPQTDGILWKDVLETVVPESDRFDAMCCNTADRLEYARPGDHVPSFEFISEDLRAKLQRR